MKRLCSLLIVVVLVLSTMGITGSATKENPVTNLAVSGSKEMTNPISTNAKGAIMAFGVLLKNAKAVTSAPKDAVRTAVIIATLQDGQTVEYKLLTNGTSCVLQKGTSYLEITPTALSTVTSSLTNPETGIGFYKFDSIPSIRIGEYTLSDDSIDYSFQQVDGSFANHTSVGPSSGGTLNLTAGSSLPIVFYNETQKPTSITVSISQKGKDLWSGTAEEFPQFNPPSAGKYTLKLTTIYNNRYYKGTVVSTASVQFGGTAGAVRFSIDGGSTYPGEVTVLRVSGLPEGASIKYASDIDFKVNFFQDIGGDYVALFPVSYRVDVGQHYIDLTVGGKAERLPIVVNNKKFQTQNLTASAETTAQTIANQKANDEFEQYIAPIRYESHKTPYWKGADFIWPVGATARVTTEFGMIRYINGSPTSSRHGAIDFAVPRGTTVQSTSNGKVLFAGNLQLTGNTVVIEHGYGLKSWYYHMDSLGVKTGATVVSGQKIGTVGSTGFSTGPHLHFGMSVNNVFINPRTVVDGDIALFNK